MPDLPPSVYGPAFVALSGAVVWSIKWARSAEREKDAAQDKMIAIYEKQIPLQAERNELTRRLLDLVE